MSEEIFVSPEELKVGQRIVGKRTGNLVPSTIIGFGPCGMVPLLVPKDNDRWEQLYPNYKEKYTVFCKFDEPVKTMSFQDAKENAEHFAKSAPFKMTEEQIIDLANFYLDETPETLYVQYPIDDVEIL